MERRWSPTGCLAEIAVAVVIIIPGAIGCAWLLEKLCRLTGLHNRIPVSWQGDVYTMGGFFGWLILIGGGFIVGYEVSDWLKKRRSRNA